MAGRIERGDVRLFSSSRPDETRPVLVLTRDSTLAFLSRATVAPIERRMVEVCKALGFALGCSG